MLRRPSGVVAWSWTERREARMECESSREEVMVSRPEISSSRVLSSWDSAEGRKVLIMVRFQKPVGAASESLSSRARMRLFFVAIKSFVAARPLALRAMSASLTGPGRAPKSCQMELTAAKPERRAMSATPTTPRRSRQALMTPS